MSEENTLTEFPSEEPLDDIPIDREFRVQTETPWVQLSDSLTSHLKRGMTIRVVFGGKWAGFHALKAAASATIRLAQEGKRIVVVVGWTRRKGDRDGKELSLLTLTFLEAA